jgi:proline dehydrogenase
MELEPVFSHQGKLDFEDTEIAFSSESDKELRKMGFLFRMMNHSGLVNIGSSLAMFSIKARLPFTRDIIRATFFDQFCGGTTLLECQPTIDKLNKFGCYTILDYGAEGKKTEEDFNNTMLQTKRSIDFAAKNQSVPVVSTKLTGMIRFDLLEKLHKGEDLNAVERVEYKAGRRRLDQLCDHAAKLGVGLMVDAEESWIQDPIDFLVLEMMKKYNKEKVIVYNTYQLYRHDKLEQMIADAQSVNSAGYYFGIKLVRGAYMEKERDRAKEHGYRSPIHENKEAVDRDYNDAVRYCVEHHEWIGSSNSSHNLFSNELQAKLIDEKGIKRNHPNLNFCQLYGMSDYITFNLARAGFNVAKYVPYGPVEDVIPYLIRRARENTAVAGGMSREYAMIRKELKRRGL